MPSSSSSLSSPTASEAADEWSYMDEDNEDDEAFIEMSKNDSGNALQSPPLSGAGENRKVQPEEVAIVAFILGCSSIPFRIIG